MDEIINQGKACNFTISNRVVNFFTRYNKLLCLTDENGMPYEMPSILYSGVSKKKLDFSLMFGIDTLNNMAIMGKSYYYTDYQNAIKCSLQNEQNSGGLIRCAVFLGKMKVPLNNPDDEVDKSRITQDMLLNYDNNSKEYKNVKLMMRISDRDRLWKNDYDSVYIGKIDLDDGSIFEEYPLWAIKNYEQQVILSSHIIDKKTLDTNLSKDDRYFII